MNSGERLKILREKNEMTQSEVAAYLNTTQSYYAQYENNRRPIPFERVVELSRLYNVSIDYIAGSTDDINRKPRYYSKKGITEKCDTFWSFAIN